MRLHSKLAASALVATFILSACGGGGADSAGGAGAPATASLGGIAAVGAPIVGGAVNVQCGSGSTATATTSATGSWTVTLPANSFPCAASVSGGTAGGAANALTLHSLALAAGTMNITTLTDLMVARLTGQVPATWYGSVSSAALGTQITSAALSTAQTLMAASLASLPGGPTLPAGFNPLTTIFSAIAGDPIDALLDLYQTALANAGISYSTSLANAAAALPLNTLPLTGDDTALNGADGATGTFDQVTRTYTANVGWLAANGVGAYNAFKTNGGSFDSLAYWKLLGVPFRVGIYACGTTDSILSISYGDGSNLYNTVGTGGSCVVEVLSVTPFAVTGRFRAKMVNIFTEVVADEVTDGYFRLAVSNGGGEALPAGEQGMSFKVDGATYRETYAESLAFGIYAGATFGNIKSSYAQLHTLPNQPGTYTCGVTADYYRAMNIWFWWNGKFYYAGSRQSLNPEGPAGSSCSITITQTGTIGGGKYTGTLEGSFSGTFVSGDGDTVTVTDGLFRFTGS